MGVDLGVKNLSGVEATELGLGEDFGVSIGKALELAFTGVLKLAISLLFLWACVSGLRLGFTPFTAPCTEGGGANPA